MLFRSGAFYVHFESKAAAFRESIIQGVSDVNSAIRQLQNQHGEAWWPTFVRFYLGTKRTCDLSESCGLQSLTPEVARSDATSRAAFETELMKVAITIAAGPVSTNAPSDVESAWIALATLIGAVTLARAVNDPTMADKIAAAAERALLPSLVIKNKTA